MFEIPPLIVREYNSIRKDIELWDTAYHQHDNPIVTDAVYDAARNRLSAIVEKYPSLNIEQSVGAPPLSKFKQIQHSAPMLSLTNVFTEKDVISFDNCVCDPISNQHAMYLAEPKIDGLAINLLYVDRVLVSASTRGDGKVGEDVTANVMTLPIDEVPHVLPQDAPSELEVRGEIYMSKSNFIRLNESQSSLGKEPFANPRSAAAGSIRQLDVSITASRNLQLLVYGIGMTNAPFANTHHQLLHTLGNWGFKISDLIRPCDNVNALLSYFKDIGAIRQEIPYDIDGVVYKVNSLEKQHRLGLRATSPVWAAAHKFPAEMAHSIVEDITIQVGRTGVLTPVARIAPVVVGSVMVSNATLFNESIVQSLGVRIGDRVLIQRSGDVIPHIVSVVIDDESTRGAAFSFPTTCPVCGAPATVNEGEVVRRCTGGVTCKAQLREQLHHFVSKKAFNIVGLGGGYLDSLINLGIVQSFASVLKLGNMPDDTRLFLSRQTGWGNVSVARLIQAVKSSINIELHKFIFALGIRHVGEGTSRALANYFGSIDNLFVQFSSAGTAGLYDKLIQIPDIGDTTAASIVDFASSTITGSIAYEVYAQIQKLGGHVYNVSLPVTKTSFTGKIVVFTGTLSQSRFVHQARAVANGMIVGNTVTKKTDFVVVGDSPGAKYNLAKQLGVRTFDESEWLSFIG